MQVHGSRKLQSVNDNKDYIQIEEAESEGANSAVQMPTQRRQESDDEDVSFLRELERENQALERELKAI